MAQIEVLVPDIGDFEDVEIVEILVADGDHVAVEDSLLSLESDKATMEIPSPQAGIVTKLSVAVGDRVSEGSLLLVLETDAAEAVDREQPASRPRPEARSAGAAGRMIAAAGNSADVQRSSAASASEQRPERMPGEAPPTPPPVAEFSHAPSLRAHASPLVRKQARELGVDLSKPQPSGPSGRLLADDVKRYVRESLSRGGDAALEVPGVSVPDFSRFGAVEVQPLSKIRRISAARLTRSWQQVPHVTQHDEVDVTAIEAFRKARSSDAMARGAKLSPVVFLMKACVLALQRYPRLRSSLAADAQGIVVKHYYHLGIAVDTDDGLIVPVVRDVDRKGLVALGIEVAALAEKARARKLAPTDLQGSVFTISSLGGIGGTAFTPIVNAPEVAVLGVSRTQTKPVWRKGEDGSGPAFVPRRMLPLSLSYDHRVIDGAEAARFTTELGRLLSDPANLLL